MNDETDVNLGLGCLSIILYIGSFFLYPLIEVVIWNWIVPDLFSLPYLTYWQMFGLSIMAQLIFGKRLIVTEEVL